MIKPILHFSHANGFPASCYHKLFSYLQADYTVNYIETLAHNPRYPVTDSWSCLVDELIVYLQQNYQQPVIGVGHSLGGVLTFLAAIREPQLFSAIVLLDTPILNYSRSLVLWLAKRFGFVDRLIPAARTKLRRNAWPSVADARQHFQDKAIFKRFDPACFEDYLQYGLEHIGQTWQLKFKPHIEYQIYRTFPHHLPWVAHRLQIPAGLLYGTESTTVPWAMQQAMSTQYDFQCLPVPGSHLFPLEHPELTAQVLRQLLEKV